MQRRTKINERYRRIYSLAGVLTPLATADNPDTVIVASLADEILLQSKPIPSFKLKSREDVVKWALRATKEGLTAKYPTPPPEAPGAPLAQKARIHPQLSLAVMLRLVGTVAVCVIVVYSVYMYTF